MSRRSLLLALFMLVLLVGGGLYGLFALLRHEPEFYLAAAVPGGSQRRAESKSFETSAVNLYNDINTDTEWRATFTELQVNSWLAEDYLHHKFPEQLHLPSEIQEPRVAFRPGRVLLAFRYGEGNLSTVVSLESRLWIAPQEPNVVVLQIESLRAGAIPFTTKMLQDRLTATVRQQNIDVQWYRHEGKPVAVLRFQANKREPSIQLQGLEIRDGAISIRGRAIEPGEAAAVSSLPPLSRP